MPTLLNAFMWLTKLPFLEPNNFLPLGQCPDDEKEIKEAICQPGMANVGNRSVGNGDEGWKNDTGKTGLARTSEPIDNK